MAAGNLEICFDNRWGKVCSDRFDQNNLRVACRALGFTASRHSSTDHHFIPPIASESGTVFEHTLFCSGSERHLNLCALGPPTSSGGVCVDTRIECLGKATSCKMRQVASQPILPALPSILVSPELYSGNLVVEEHRRAGLQCVADEGIYPPVTQVLITPSKKYHYHTADIKGLC